MDKTEIREEFAKRFAQAVMPSEENNFKGYFTKELWPLDHCASLVAGLDPETYRNAKRSLIRASACHNPEKPAERQPLLSHRSGKHSCIFW
jgi:hypothetical protein